MDFQLTEEQKMLTETTRRFAREEIIPIADKCDRDNKFPHEVAKKAFDLGLIGVEIPTAYGGAGMGVLANCMIIEELNYGCSGIATSLLATNLGVVPIILGGNDEQKKKWLGRCASELTYGSYCTTEPGAGSDVAALECKATAVGKDWVLNGTKQFITNGSFAHFYIVFATVDRAQRHKGIAAFIVPKELPGVRAGKKEDKMGQRASDTAVVHFDDVKCGPDLLLAPPGQGFRLAMMTFDRTRPWIGAGAVGVMRRALDESRAYAIERKTFGVPIAEHQAIQFMLAEMAIKIEATRLLVHKAAWMLDNGDPVAIVSAYAKAFGADACMQVTTDAVQIFGGYGYVKDYPVEKLMRDSKIFQIYEGTSQIQRMVIARHILGQKR